MSGPQLPPQTPISKVMWMEPRRGTRAEANSTQRVRHEPHNMHDMTCEPGPLSSRPDVRAAAAAWNLKEVS
jgi:hypothetical protein